jgi:hypothetical protein
VFSKLRLFRLAVISELDCDKPRTETIAKIAGFQGQYRPHLYHSRQVVQMKVDRRLDVSVFERWVKAASEFPSILLSFLRSRSCTLVSLKLEFVMNTVQSIESSNQALRPQSPAIAIESLKSGLLPLAHRRQFVTWKLIQIAGRPKPSKIPFVNDGSTLKGGFDNPALQDRLMTLDEAVASAKLHQHNGIGLVFTPGCGVVGIDLDGCVVDGEFVGTPEQQEAFAIFEPHSFIEHSQSGRGIHAIALGDAATNKQDGILELFGNKNFLALTGMNGKGIASEIPVYELNRVDEIVCHLKGVTRRRQTFDPNLNSDLITNLKSSVGRELIEDVREVLRHLDPSCDRDRWMRIIWGIHHGLGDTPEARLLADEWSQGRLYKNGNSPSNYSGRIDVENIFDAYDSSNPSAITFGTVIKLATDCGYNSPHKLPIRQNLAIADSEVNTPHSSTALFNLTDGQVNILQTPPAKREYIFAETVMAGTYNVLAGSGGTLKTMLMLTTAAAMAVGRNLGDIKIAQGASMLFLGEEDHAEVSRRLSAACLHYGYDGDMVEKLVKAFPSAGVDLRLTRNLLGSLEETSFKANVIELAKQHAQKCGSNVRLIVFDHARLVMDGDPDDAADVTQLTRILTSIAQLTGAAVMLLAHSPKSVLKQQAKEMTVADVAGSSAFSDNARSGFIMYGMREDDAKAYQISDDDRKKYVKLECAKSNYSLQGTTWWFERQQLVDWQTAVLKPATLNKPMFTPGQTKQKLRQRIIDLIAQSPGRSARYVRELAGQKRSLGASEKEVVSALDALLEEGRLERRRPTPSEVVRYKLHKGRELLFVLPTPA